VVAGAVVRALGGLAAVALLAGCATVPSAPAPVVPSVAVTSAPAQRPTVAPATTAPPRPATAVRVPKLSIESASNFRDVAGRGLVLPGSGRMARGVVYRSGRLTNLSTSDRRELAAAGVTDIYDLRTTRVARRSPDRSIKGADYHLINLFAVYSTPSRTFASVSAARADRRRTNREFVTDPEQRRRTAKVLTEIAQADGPVIVHCTEGKDRTGWVAAVLQLAAGASRKDVVAEYLLSNSYRKAEIEKRYASVRRSRGTRAADIDHVAWVVDKSFLQAGLNELGERYGSVDRFLSKGLKLSPETMRALRDRLRA